MKFDWNHWNIGGKTICVATCVAVGSMFTDWVTLGFMSLSGMQQGAWMFLACWIYPVAMLLRGKDINQTWGLMCATASILAAGCYIQSKSVELLGKTVNASGGGPALFILASIALGVGVLKYRRALPPVPCGGYK